MKKILTILLGSLMLVAGLSLCVSAADGFSITSAAEYAIGEAGVAIYVNDIPDGTEEIVFTINGVDCAPTMDSPYVAMIGYGPNEIYATAYGAGDEVYGVTDTIGIYGNDYTAFSTLKMHDFDTTDVDVYRIDGSGGDKTKVVSKKLNIAPPSDDPEKPNPPEYVAYLKSENPFDGWQAYRADIVYSRTYFKAAYDKGADTVAYTFDIKPLNVDKTSSIASMRYNNDANGFAPFLFNTDETITVATSISATYAKDIVPIIPAPNGEWRSFKIIMDSANGEIILVADGVVYSSFGFDSAPEASRLNFQTTCTKSYITFIVEANGMGAEGRCNEFYVDNFGYLSSNHLKRYAVSASTVTGDGETEGLDGFPLSGASAKLEFSEEMAEINEGDIIFEVNGRAVNFTLSYDEDANALTITPLYSFIGREKCKISYADVKTTDGASAMKDPFIEFDAKLPPCAISEISAGELEAGEDAAFTVKVKNDLPDNKDAMVLLGFYKDGGLESVVTGDATCLAGGAAQCDITVSVPGDFSSEDYKIVAYFMYKDSFFIIDSFEYQV